MTNQIAVIHDSVSLILNKMKVGTNQKSRIYNESKNVTAKTAYLVISNPRFASLLPDHRKNKIFYLSD